jgi:hypothetical protein
MKKFIWFIFALFSLQTQGQRLLILSLEQPPELSFTASPATRDLIIIKGDSVQLASDIKISGGSGSYSYRWSPGTGLKDSVILKPWAKPEKSTTYIITVTDKNGCSFGVDYKITVNPSTPAELIPSGDREMKVLIYPNPCRNKFNLHLTGKPAPQIEVFLTDLAGRRLYLNQITNFTGDLTMELNLPLPAGSYLFFVQLNGYTAERHIIILK